MWLVGASVFCVTVLLVSFSCPRLSTLTAKYVYVVSSKSPVPLLSSIMVVSLTSIENSATVVVMLLSVLINLTEEFLLFVVEVILRVTLL